MTRTVGALAALTMMLSTSGCKTKPNYDEAAAKACQSSAADRPACTACCDAAGADGYAWTAFETSKQSNPCSCVRSR